MLQFICGTFCNNLQCGKVFSIYMLVYFFVFFYIYRNANKKVTLAILGLDNAGKTVTAKSLQGGKYSCVSNVFDLISVILIIIL